MKKELVRSIIAAAVIALPGVVQSQSVQPQPASKRAENARESLANEMRASNVKGANVVDAQGKKIGEISDLMLDLNSGRVHSAVLEFGGFLGMGEKHYAYPMSSFRPGKDKDQFVLNVNKDQLKNSEGFEKDKWPAGNDSYWSRITKGDRKGAAAATGVVRASTLMGKDLIGSSGDDVGEVKDVVLDRNGGIRWLVVDVDGTTKEARVQPKAVSWNGDDKPKINMTRDQLQAAAKGGTPTARRDRNTTPGSAASSGGPASPVR